MTVVPQEQESAAGPAADVRQTRFKDVCGSIDEFKRVVYEEPERAAADGAPIESLIDDALYMLARMELRLAEYEAFRRTVQALAAELEGIGGSRRADGIAAAQALRKRLARGTPLEGETREAVVASAEAVRDAAQDLENKMSRYKAVALALERAYRQVKGARVWVLDEAEAAQAAALPGELVTVGRRASPRGGRGGRAARPGSWLVHCARRRATVRTVQRRRRDRAAAGPLVGRGPELLRGRRLRDAATPQRPAVPRVRGPARALGAGGRAARAAGRVIGRRRRGRGFRTPCPYLLPGRPAAARDTLGGNRRPP
jgi:hypothetical protein